MLKAADSRVIVAKGRWLVKQSSKACNFPPHGKLKRQRDLHWCCHNSGMSKVDPRDNEKFLEAEKQCLYEEVRNYPTPIAATSNATIS